MVSAKSSDMAPGANLRKDLRLENEIYWFKRHPCHLLMGQLAISLQTLPDMSALDY
jgi:hypothetical protein